MKKEYHHGKLRQELIEAGIQMVSTEGIKKLSLRKLAASCGVSEAAPYSHFAGKEELMQAMQEHVTGQLMQCLQNAVETTEDPDSPQAVLNMGKAYVLFFMKYPEYYTFLFMYQDRKVNLSLAESGDNDVCFQYYRDKVFQVYRKTGMAEERIQYGMVGMWAKVHGLAAIVSMKNVQKDFVWEDVLDKVLIE